MRTILNLNFIYQLSCFFLIFTLYSCGSYQGVSYYASDGIYSGEVAVRTTPAQAKTNPKGVYYKDYFNNIADDYTSLDNPQDYVYTDTENYSSKNGNGNVRVNSQAPWGDQSSRTEVYYINNNPWGYFNFNRGFYGGFYGGFYNPFYDPFWGYSPFYNGGFMYPNWGLGFYDPFFYRGGINFGYRFYRNNFLMRHRLFNRFYGYGNNRGYARSGYSRGYNSYSNRNATSRASRAGQINNQVNSFARANINSRVSSNNYKSSNVNRYNIGRRPQNDKSNQGVTKNASSQTNQNNTYRSSSQSNSRSYSNNSSRSSTSNYNSGRSYSPPRSYSSSGRSSSYSSGSRGSSSGGRSSSRSR